MLSVTSKPYILTEIIFMVKDCNVSGIDNIFILQAIITDRDLQFSIFEKETYLKKNTIDYLTEIQ